MTDSARSSFANTAPGRLDDLLDELAGQIQAGEPVDIEAYLQAHPEHADELRRMLPAMQVLAGLEASRDNGTASEPETPLGELGDFRLIREVGRGGMGVVYEAEQITLRRRVAVKLLPFASALDGKQLQRFKNEAQAAAHLHHTNIVPVYFVGSERGVHYYAMQFIDGQTVADVIAELRGDPSSSGGAPNTPSDASGASGPAGASGTIAYHDLPGTPEPNRPVSLPKRQVGETRIAALTTERSHKSRAFFRTVAQWGIQAAEALDHAHEQGVVHRDIKPVNLMLDGKGLLWITDFGLAQFQTDANLTLTGDLIGTVRYMSPEQALAKRIPVDHRTDVYSLGATLYELLTLHPAVDGRDRSEILRQISFDDPKPPRRHNASIPRELETIVLKALEKHPDGRYATAQELADDLRHWLDDKPIRAKRPGLSERVAKWLRRHKYLVRSAVAVLLTAGAVLAGSVGYVARDRATQKAEADNRRAVTERLAKDAFEEADRWEKAGRRTETLMAFKRAEAMLVGGGADAELLRTVRERRTDLEMLVTLDGILISKGPGRGDPNHQYQAGADYAAAFRQYGIDLDALSVEEAAAHIREKAIRIELALALDDWAFRRRYADAGVSEAQHLRRVSRLADPDEWRDRLRAGGGRTELEDIVATIPVDEKLPATTAILLGYHLNSLRMMEQAADILAKAQRIHPDNFWINHDLAWSYMMMKAPRLQESIRYFTAALVLRPLDPGVNIDLASALVKTGSVAEGMAYYKDAIRLGIREAGPCIILGMALSEQNLRDDAIAVYREAIRVQPDNALAHSNLGVVLTRKGALNDAIATYREATRVQPGHASAHNNLAWLLANSSDHKLRNSAEAVQLATRAVELVKINPSYWNSLGAAQYRAGDWNAAIAAQKKSMDLGNGGDSFSFFFLAMAHWQIGDEEQARRWYARAVQWMDQNKPHDEELHRFRAEAAELLGIKE